MNAHQTAATETAALLVETFPAVCPRLLDEVAADVVAANARAFGVAGAEVLDRMTTATAETIAAALPDEVDPLDEFDLSALVDDVVDACAVWLLAADALARFGVTLDTDDLRERVAAA